MTNTDTLVTRSIKNVQDLISWITKNPNKPISLSYTVSPDYTWQTIPSLQTSKFKTTTVCITDDDEKMAIAMDHWWNETNGIKPGINIFTN